MAARGLRPTAAGRCRSPSAPICPIRGRLCLAPGVGPVLAHLLWCAVRVGALGSRYRWAGWWRDAPAVLGTGAAVYAAARLVVPWLDRGAHLLLGG